MRKVELLRRGYPRRRLNGLQASGAGGEVGGALEANAADPNSSPPEWFRRREIGSVAVVARAKAVRADDLVRAASDARINEPSSTSNASMSKAANCKVQTPRKTTFISSPAAKP
jgi:hypothetical protein